MSLQVINLKKRKVSELSCLFCDKTGDLVKNPKLQTFTTIQRAADRRKDDISKKLESDTDFIAHNCSWHRACIATYISEEKIRRRELALLKQENASVPTSSTEANVSGSQRVRRSSRNELKIDTSNKCLICGKQSRNKNKTLLLCSEISAAEQILNIARKKQDDVFTKISICEHPADLFAMEVRYHKHCYRDYLRQPRNSENPAGRPSSQIPHGILMEAFEKLIDEMKDKLTSHSFEVSFLGKRLAELTEIEDAIVENRVMKSLLIDKYGENVLFSYPSDRSKSSLVFMGNIPLDEVIEHIRTVNSTNYTVQVAKQLRKEILNTKVMPDGYLCDEILIEQFLQKGQLPNNWLMFMQALFSSKNNKLSENYNRRALSVFYDMYFTITEKHTPKHIALAQSIHHLTRSKQLIVILNKCGHSISYKALKNLDNEVTTSIVCEDIDKKLLIPKNIVRDSSLFLHGAIDNNDFNEETLSGKGSTHVTAMVIYQEKKSTDNEVNLIKMKPTVELNELDLKFLNCQAILHFQENMQPSIPDYKDSSCLLNNNQNNLQFDNLLWVLCRLQYSLSINNFCRSSTNSVPGWTPFQQILSSETAPVSTVGFSPVIPQPPTSKDVVYTAMKNYVNVSLALGKKIAVLSCDMAIYLIAKNIQLTNKEFDNLILRIGSFHLQKNYLRCLGQYVEESGLDGILIEADIYGENTLASILKGTHYNRGIRAHKLLYEALRSIQIAEFIECMNYSQDFLQQLNICLQEIRESTVDKDHSGVIEKHDQYKRIITDFLMNFSHFLRTMSTENQVFKYLNNYCEMVEILLNSVMADRNSNYELHLLTTRQMLPFFFSMNHTNYIRGVTLYLQDMIKLPLEVEHDMKRGMVSVKRTEGKFNAVSPDLALEQSQNRSSAVTGGLIGITKNEEAMQRWLLLYPFKNSIHEAFSSYLEIQADSTSDINYHNEWTQSRINKDEKDIQNIIKYIIACNPYNDNANCALRNIYTGELAEESSVQCLLNIQENGEALLRTYEDERFVLKSKKLSDPIKKNKFSNFVTHSQKQNKSTSNKKLQDATDVSLIQKTFLLANQRGFDAKILASFEILNYCKYLFDAEGFYRKSPKSQLALEIENNHKCGTNTRQDILNLPFSKIYIVDGMALVHRIQLKNFSTFGDFAQAFFNRIQNLFSQPNVKRVDIVFDRYDDISIKYLESTLRSKGQMMKNFIISNEHTKIPANCNNFFSSTENKLQLVRFLCTAAPRYAQVNEDCELYICGGFEDPTKCFKLQGSSFFEVPDLNSNHLEADSRMFGHIFHAVKIKLGHIIIICADTDVFILGIYFWNKLARLGCLGLWFDGSYKKKFISGCHLAAQSLGENICGILPALHALSGCDSTSRFGSKKNALNAASLDFVQEALKHLGNPYLSVEQLKELENICTYLFSKKNSTADELRYKLISQNIGFGLNLLKVICTSDALHLHLLRASAQTYVWVNADQTLLQPIDYTFLGYERKDDKLYPRQMTKQPLPELLIQPCKCTSNCKTMACSCKKLQIDCIALCKCINNDCQNKKD